MTLYRKYRPQTFGEVEGQDHVVETLRRAIALDRVAHAYLFCGARGVGKTTVARLLAKAVNCLDKKNKPCGKCKNCLAIAAGNFIDLIEIDAASNRGIDEVRELRDKIKFSPSIGKKKVYIIDEVHMLTREAFNALLKTLEEPPAHSIFIFATTEVHKLPETVISRCQRFDFRLAQKGSIAKNIKEIAKSEKFDLPDDVLDLLIRASGGSYRDAQTMLGQLEPHLEDGKLTYELALSVLQISHQGQIDDFIKLLREADANKAIEYIAALKEKGVDFGSFLDELIYTVRENLIEGIKSGAEVDWEKTVLKRLLEAEKEAKVTPVASLPLELAVIDLASSEINQNQISNVVGSRSEGWCGQSQKQDSKFKNGEEDTVKLSKQPEKIIEKPEPKPEKAVPVRDTRTEDPRFAEQIGNFSAGQRMAIIGEVAHKNKSLSVLLSSAEWRSGRGGIHLGVEYPLYKEKIMSKNNLTTIESEIEKILGTKTRLTCEVLKGKEQDLEEGIGEVFELES